MSELHIQPNAPLDVSDPLLRDDDIAYASASNSTTGSTLTYTWQPVGLCKFCCGSGCVGQKSQRCRQI